MVRKFVWAATLVVFCVCVKYAFALGGLVPVTKATQAKEGLKFTLTAERVSDEVVMVRMEIPREGKLKDLRSVGMSLGKKQAFENGSPALSVQLQPTTGKGGSWEVAFQLTPEMADRCTVNLNVPHSPMWYVIYSVEVKGYITDRKPINQGQDGKSHRR